MSVFMFYAFLKTATDDSQPSGSRRFKQQSDDAAIDKICFVNDLNESSGLSEPLNV